jgi:hypothetical protein
MLYREIIAVCSEIHTKPTNALSVWNADKVNHWALEGQGKRIICQELL